MPSLAEGGGSFPVWEALTRGVPVLCSKIPVMEEMLGFVGGDVLWFDPDDYLDLASKLEELQANYAAYKTRAKEQVHLLRRWTWRDVADRYWSTFLEMA
jgi:glycosyltransferase involved in cell wall biosynthesis